MKDSTEQVCRITITLGVILLWANTAHAQRIPIELVWSAGTALVAPFIAVPIKIGLIHFTRVKHSDFRPWSLSLMEWFIWFPTTFVLLQLSDSNLIPVVIPGLYALSTWLHRSWIANASWRLAIVLSLITPVMAVAIPLLAAVTIGFLQSLSV